MQNRLIGVTITSQQQAASTPSCPIRLKMCLPICYWNKQGKCKFPPQGYDKGGRVNRKKKVATSFNMLRARLESERKRLMEQLEQLQARIRPAEERREGSPFGKREEEATEAAELEKRLVLEKRIKNLLAEVEHALEKCGVATYGLCDICDKPIDPARLEALPQASLCLSCRTHYESGGDGLRNIVKGGEQQDKEAKAQP